MTKEEWKLILLGSNDKINKLIVDADSKLSEVMASCDDEVDETTRLMIIHTLIKYFDNYLHNLLHKNLNVDPALGEMSADWAQKAAEIDLAQTMDAAEKEVKSLSSPTDPAEEEDDDIDISLDPDAMVTMKGGDA